MHVNTGKSQIGLVQNQNGSDCLIRYYDDVGGRNPESCKGLDNTLYGTYSVYSVNCYGYCPTLTNTLL